MKNCNIKEVLTGMILPDDPHHDALGLRQDDHQQDN